MYKMLSLGLSWENFKTNILNTISDHPHEHIPLINAHEHIPLINAHLFLVHKPFSKEVLKLMSYRKQIGSQHGEGQTKIFFKSLNYRDLPNHRTLHGIHNYLKTHLGTKDGEEFFMGMYSNYKISYTPSINAHLTCLTHLIFLHFSKDITQPIINKPHCH